MQAIIDWVFHENKVIKGIFPSILFAFLIGIWGNAAASSNRAYEAERLKIIEGMKAVLIRAGMCRDGNDCVGKQYVFASPESDGIEVEIYGITQSHILFDMVKVCADPYFGSNRKMSVRVRIYDKTKAEQLATSIWKRGRPSEILFSGVK